MNESQTSWTLQGFMIRDTHCKNFVKRLLNSFSVYSLNLHFGIWDFNSKKQPSRGVLKEKVFWTYAANLQENTHTLVQFQ